MSSVFLPVTHRVRRAYTQAESRTQVLGLPLTRLGAKLCAKLGKLPVRVVSEANAGDTESVQTTLQCGT